MIICRRSRDTLELIKGMTQKTKGRMACIKDETEKTLTESTEVLESWKRYSKNIYCDPATRSSTDVLQEDHDTKIEFSRSEVEQVIKSLKDGKSPGCDNISAEMIKASGEEGVKIYYHLCVRIRNSGIWPINWKRSVFTRQHCLKKIYICVLSYHTIDK